MRDAPPRQRQSAREAQPSPTPPLAPLAQVIGRARLMVLVGVGAVLLVAATLFGLGAWLALHTAWNAIRAVWSGDTESMTTVTVAFLEIVSVMLKAVIFYLIGAGLFSLFVAPLNLPTALGVETLNDLESKIISVVIVIMAITFLEHFITWRQPTETLLFGVALALVVGALVLFQSVSNRAKAEQHPVEPAVQRRAQRDLVHYGNESHSVSEDDAAPTGREP